MTRMSNRLRATALALLAAAALALPACEGELGEGPAGPSGTRRTDPRSPDDPRSPGEPVYEPPSVRRLTSYEYDHAIEDLLGISGHPSSGFAGEARVAGYTSNADLRVDAVLGDQIRSVAESLATEALRSQRARVVPCDASDAGCPRELVTAIATRAFRRPARSEDVEALLALFELAAEGGTFDDGASAVLQAVLQSASFLYVPRIGVGEGPARTLDGYETASALSFLLTAAPPDAELLVAAAGDALRTPDQREAEARRILAESPRAHAQLARFVREWLGLDRLGAVARSAPSGDFDALRPLMEEETERFVGEVVLRGEGTFEALLTADFTLANGELASFYGLPEGDAGWSRRSLAGTARRGLLTQAAFLAGHARNDSSSPVQRGVTILNRIFCHEIPPPTGAAAAAAMMPPPPARTTRERFAQHSADPTCAGCHDRIDPIGFGFESFDQLGAHREDEGGVAVDTTGTLVGTDVDGPFADAAELVARIATSEEAHACFARNVFRFATGRADRGPEDTFFAQWEAMPEGRRTALVEIFVELIRSDLFVQREEAE